MHRNAAVTARFRRIFLTGFITLIILGAVNPSLAGSFTDESTYEMGLRLGYGQTCKAKETIRFYNFLPRWGVFLTRPDNPVLGQLRLSFILEGIIGVLDASRTGWDIGFTPLLKISYPLSHRLLGYIEGGAGVIWENLDSPAFAHTFNFSPQVGAGIDIKLVGNYALSLAYRFRHTSNAGLYKENPGVNTNFAMVGLTYYF